MTFETVALILLVFLAGLYVYTQIRNFRRLGKRLIPAKGGLTNLNVLSFFFLGVTGTYFVVAAFADSEMLQAQNTPLLFLSIALISVMLIAQISWKKGFYENGIQCNSLAMGYSQ
ncbi:MAG: hypothetical protein LBC69_03155, partial [Eubacteriaceae bacterium]|nr:hypothetical protein [Eubacteriaceae bacterium]